jgi:acetyl esterase/lipase
MPLPTISLLLAITAVLPLASVQAMTPQTCTYKRVGDLEIKADVYGATGEAVRPVIVWIHGGALIGGDRTSLSKDQCALYVNAGYVVVSIDYRLAPETKLEGIIEDLKDVFLWVAKEGPKLWRIDPKQMAVIGHSAGGYLTLMSGFCVEPKPKALVAFYGYGDIAGDWYTKPSPYYTKKDPVSKEDALASVGTAETTGNSPTTNRFVFYLYCRQNGLWTNLVSGHDPNTEPDYLARFCPIRNVTEVYPPTMLLHGDADNDVPYQQSAQMSEELARHEVDHEFLTIPNGGHGFDGRGGGVGENPEVKAVFDKVLGWLSAKLGEP